MPTHNAKKCYPLRGTAHAHDAMLLDLPTLRYFTLLRYLYKADLDLKLLVRTVTLPYLTFDSKGSS